MQLVTLGFEFQQRVNVVVDGIQTKKIVRPLQYMHFWSYMKFVKSITILFLTSIISACAQIPSSGQKINLSSDITNKKISRNLNSCGIKVEFQGTPEEMTFEQITEMFPFPLRREASHGFIYRFLDKKTLKTQLATCGCTDVRNEYSTAIDSDFKSIFRVNTDDFLSLAEYPTINQNGNQVRVKTVVPKGADNCYAFQIVTADTSDTSVIKEMSFDFFSTLKLIPLPSSNLLLQSETNSSRERLIQIDQLLKDKLITEAEYQKRRLVILESL